MIKARVQSVLYIMMLETKHRHHSQHQSAQTRQNPDAIKNLFRNRQVIPLLKKPLNQSQSRHKCSYCWLNSHEKAETEIINLARKSHDT
jgi:hypothetical protein